MYHILSCKMGLLLVALALPIALLFLLLKELSKPVDKKWKLRGRKWKLPPGPKGSPIVGNLLQFSRARDTGKLIPYVRTSTLTLIPHLSHRCGAMLMLAYSSILWQNMGRCPLSIWARALGCC
jgi:hypothetical protein